MPLLLIASACGLKAPVTTTCVINGAVLNCSNGKKKQDKTITAAQADRYLCESPADFLNSALYIIHLETDLAKCFKEAVVQPVVTVCAIDSPNLILYCSTGVVQSSVSFQAANKYLCLSGTDFELMVTYKNTLMEGIAACPQS